MSLAHRYRSLWYTAYAVVVVVLLLFVPVGLPRTQVVWEMLAGWYYYFRDVVLQARVSGSGIATGIVTALVCIAGIHTVGSWLVKSWGGSSAGAAPVKRTWRWRWTLALAAGLVLLFTAGVAIVVIVHQVVWLINDARSGRVG